MIINRPIRLAGAVGLGLIAGVQPLALDAANQIHDPLAPVKKHASFKLVLTSTSSNAALMSQAQNTITGAIIQWPPNAIRPGARDVGEPSS
jgi:hypothetical protein